MTEAQAIDDFRETVWNHYRSHKRTMPWRDDPSPYRVLVSEMMLQQTQVSRVTPKFLAFIAQFPDIRALADAPLSDVLACWSGLGYNRRAKYLWETAKIVARTHDGALPGTFPELTALPGIGANTAGAILAYAFEQPVVFIETNIRTCLLHHFFDGDDTVTDASLRLVAQKVLSEEHPREWYWALMDYGAYLKRTAGGQLHRVHSYRVQTAFEGSRRQVRGAVLRLLAEHSCSAAVLQKVIDDSRLPDVLVQLQKEGLIAHTHDTWHLTGDTLVA